MHFFVLAAPLESTSILSSTALSTVQSIEPTSIASTLVTAVPEKTVSEAPKATPEQPRVTPALEEPKVTPEKPKATPSPEKALEPTKTQAPAIGTIVVTVIASEIDKQPTPAVETPKDYVVGKPVLWRVDQNGNLVIAN
ncbi:hypothetical protein EDD86DRAFT_246123 [Gorgonomyces haynaldii]|nr:hypothetical protein EDD86DRAFT_246123 [Gorgonomyces haynaldii]